MSNTKHQAFIDLMKAFGMFLIVYGHVIGSPNDIYNLVSQPAFTKQIGVAFFVFITGWGLANNQRPGERAVFNRLFPFYFWGILFAVFLSILFLFTKGDTNPTNYLPFFFGVNVFLNYFPANPTTWYIGTYIHILAFWYFFLRGKQIGIGHIIVALIIENIVRCFFIYQGQNFIAYMLLPNWLSVFLLGMYCHNKRQQTALPAAGGLLLIWVGLLALWPTAMSVFEFSGTFPFQHIVSDSPLMLGVESMLISTIYFVNTYLFFEIARRLPGHRFISYLSAATLITVIIHMPIIFNLHSYFYSFFDNRYHAQISFIFVVYFSTAIIANTLQRFVDITPLREQAWNLLSTLYFSIFKRS